MGPRLQRSHFLWWYLLMLSLITIPTLAAEFRVPLLSQPPTIDGKFSPEEWSVSAGFDGFENQNQLVRRRVRAFVAATETHIYLAMQTQLPAEGALLAEVKDNLLDVARDDAVEIFISPSPGEKDAVIYQFLSNSLGFGAYDVFCTGSAREDMAWKGNWQHAHGFQDGWWTFECAIPLASLTSLPAGRKTTDGAWRINLTRDWKAPRESSAIAPGKYLDGGLVFTFAPSDTPAVQYTCDRDPFFGGFTGSVTLTNPSTIPMTLKAALMLTRAPQPELRKEQTLTLAPGATAQVQLAVPDDEQVKSNQLRVNVTSADGQTVYYDRVSAWKRENAAYTWIPINEQAVKALLPVAPVHNEMLFGARIQRTMTLLATSNKSRRNPVHIILYGQSIVGSGWWKLLEEDLRARFPHADLVIENKAIGGFGSEKLVRTAMHDLYYANPDLVLFHCYGITPAGNYERIVSNLRRYTTADIMLFSHHVRLQQPESAPWETAGSTAGEDINATFTRYIAQKYGCEYVDVRDEWKQYLRDHQLMPKLLLSDPTHLNSHGYELLAHLIGRHFRFNTTISDPWVDRVRTYEAKRPVVEGAFDEITYSGEPWMLDGTFMVGSSPNSALKLTFEGNRVDVMTGYTKAGDKPLGTARILIDGKPPSADPRLYAITRPSKARGIWMPAVTRVDHNVPLILEDWTLRITKITDDAKEFTYEVFGSVTGPDGVGNNAERFVSNSGRVVIAPADLERITWASSYTKKPCTVGFEVTWSVVPAFLDTYTAPTITEKERVYQITLATGLENGTHTLEIIPNGDGIVPIEGIQVHRPPLR